MSAYTIDSAHIALHFARKKKATSRPRRDVAALVEQLHQAEIAEREAQSLDHEEG